MGDSPRFLVTGAYGCIGAWVVRELVMRSFPVVTLDSGGSPRRLRLLLSDSELAGVPHEDVNILDLPGLTRVLDSHRITHIVHLAALQVPFCKADPPLGAQVNVVGTVNVFEAAKARKQQVRQVVYASSVAAYDAYEQGTHPQMVGIPGTHYGVYKRANEGSAWIYWQDDRVGSIGLRPHTVYGVGRDQGMTSAPTTAMLAAAAGVPFHIPYGGASQLQFARDVAGTFVDVSLADHTGASVHNVAGPKVAVSRIIETIATVVPEAAARITYSEVPLPFPEEVDSSSLQAIVGSVPQTPLEVGIEETIKRFRDLLSAGLVAAPGQSSS
jgi:UDP-glucuronate 4-epimerase